MAAGVRVKESGLSLAPSLPEQWNSLEFKGSVPRKITKSSYG
ncbi:glycosyl hydrolase family 65 protein [Virgibacillus pantothenticus]